MSWYLVIKWLHIVSSTALFGTGAGIAFFLLRAQRTGDARIIASVGREVVLADVVFTATAVILQPVTGIALALMAGFPLSKPWILTSMVLYVLVPRAYSPGHPRTASCCTAKRGWNIFNSRGRCNKCHALTEDKPDVTTFTDNDFHNIGIIRHNVVALARQAEQLVNSGDSLAIDNAAIQTEMSALGRFLISKKESDIAAFKTPDLRNVLMTAPYFHDGSQETLWDVVDHYNKGDGLHNPYLDEDIQPLALREGDIDDVVAFLASLTSSIYKDQGVKELARQRQLSRTQRPQRDTARAFGPKPLQPKPPPP